MQREKIAELIKLRVTGILVIASMALAACLPDSTEARPPAPALPDCDPLTVSVYDEEGVLMDTKEYGLISERLFDRNYDNVWSTEWSLHGTSRGEVQSELAAVASANNFGLRRQGISMIRFYDPEVDWEEHTDAVSCPEDGQLKVGLRLSSLEGWEWLNREEGIDKPRLAYTDGQSQVQVTLPRLAKAWKFPEDNRQCVWEEGDPVGVSGAESSFKIVWGSPEATYVRAVISAVGDECTYQTGADGTAYGVFTVNTDK